jgi:hypothetical protein
VAKATAAAASKASNNANFSVHTSNLDGAAILQRFFNVADI